MREEVISSGGTTDLAPAASSAGASSPAAPANISSIDRTSHAHGSKEVSLSNAGSQQPRTSLSTSAGGSALGSSRPSCRPWERGDLLRRLASFRPSNWFGKPEIASSLACAQRGWMSVDADKISCESCGAFLSFITLPSWSTVEAEGAGVSFFKQLDDGHKSNCTWRGNSCPESLVQFPPAPQSALIGGYKDRCDGLLQFQCLPLVAASAVEHMRITRGPQIERFLSQVLNFTTGDVDYKAQSIPELDTSQDGALCLYSRTQKLISLCGWEPRWLPDVQDCEEHSAQSARNGCSSGPPQDQIHGVQNHGTSKNAFSASAKRNNGKSKVLGWESRCESRSPLLDCSLCGATVRILDFITISRPARFAVNDADIPETNKKMVITRGASAASGINGWVAADDGDKEQRDEREEVATTNKGKSLASADVDLNLTMAGGLFYNQLGRNETSDNIPYDDMGRDLMIGQPAGSEVGDRAASYESRGPISRKRSLELGGSSNDRQLLRMQQADSVEGTVIDRDADEVTGGVEYSAGPSKRVRDSDAFDPYSYQRESSGAGPSHSVGFDTYADTNTAAPSRQESDRGRGILSARDSTRASSVIAMDTIGHSADDDSMESVENHPRNADDAHFPSSSTYGNLDMNENSELNYSNQAQQSIFQAASGVPRGDVGGSSTNDGEEIFNADNVTPQARGGFSFGISGVSVGMCASHEAEIHGTDVSIYRADSVHRAESVVGDIEPRIEDVENQGQTGESAPDPGIMDEIIPEELNREDPHGDSQEVFSRSVGRADSSSKIDGSAKAESVESGDKPQEHSAHPSLSCNAVIYSGYETSKNDVATTGKASSMKESGYLDTEFAAIDGIGPPKGESNYDEITEFDPIIHHNQFCPWVNRNVAAAGCRSFDPSTNADSAALSGWQLTLDALDILRMMGHLPSQTGQSESAASLYKDDHRTPSKKLLKCPSVKSHGQHKKR